MIGAHGAWARPAAGVLGPLILAAIGMGLVIAPSISTGTFGVAPQDAGVASATVTVGQQLGASIGTSLLNTIFASAVTSYLTANLASARIIGRQALTGLVLAHGYDTAFWWTAGIRLRRPGQFPTRCCGPVKTALGRLAVAAKARAICSDRRNGGSVNSKLGFTARITASHASYVAMPSRRGPWTTSRSADSPRPRTRRSPAGAWRRATHRARIPPGASPPGSRGGRHSPSSATPGPHRPGADGPARTPHLRTATASHPAR